MSSCEKRDANKMSQDYGLRRDYKIEGLSKWKRREINFTNLTSINAENMMIPTPTHLPQNPKGKFFKDFIGTLTTPVKLYISTSPFYFVINIRAESISTPPQPLQKINLSLIKK
jgi:hypothetical protein